MKIFKYKQEVLVKCIVFVENTSAIIDTIKYKIINKIMNYTSLCNYFPSSI